MATKKEVTKTENETPMAEVKKITKASNKVTKEEKVDVPDENELKTVIEEPVAEEQPVEVKKEEPKVEEKPVDVKKEEPKQEKKEEIKKPLGRPVTKYWGGINDGWY